MDEKELLEENVVLTLTPLQTILLSESVILLGNLIDHIRVNNMAEFKKIDQETNEVIEGSEGVGRILMDSSSQILHELRKKIWEEGTKVFGASIPEEHSELVWVFTILTQAILQRVAMLKE